MSTLLALDTATEACSVALLHDGKVTSHYEVIPRLHAQKLLPMIQQLLADAGTTLQAVDAIAFGRGPGAFTGVRIAIGVVQGLAFALDRPVLPVSNLAVLAQRAYREHGVSQVAAAIDARQLAHIATTAIWVLQSCHHFCIDIENVITSTAIKHIVATEAANNISLCGAAKRLRFLGANNRAGMPGRGLFGCGSARGCAERNRGRSNYADQPYLAFDHLLVTFPIPLIA